MEPWQKAINTLKGLIKERSGPEWWSANIVDSSCDLVEKRDWALFYSYLSNPAQFNPAITPVTLDDLHVIPTDIEPYPPELKEERFQNCGVTHIRVSRVESDDEKI